MCEAKISGLAGIFLKVLKKGALNKRRQSQVGTRDVRLGEILRYSPFAWPKVCQLTNE